MKTENLLKQCQKDLEYRMFTCKASFCNYRHLCKACRNNEQTIGKIIMKLAEMKVKNEHSKS
jgi:hypothetical protein